MIETTTLPGWRKVKRLGRGSYGPVYEICREDDEAFRDALKIISIPYDDSEIDMIREEGMPEESIGSYYKERADGVINEIKMMYNLQGHTNIVSYHDYQCVPHKENYGYDILIRMELLTPLTKYVERHPMSVNDVRKLGTDMLAAIGLCEKCNIIHRDIKPDNIFVSRIGDFKLGGFDSAANSTGDLSVTGTYNYMAPEEYRGERYGMNVDLYSLGMVLYKYLNHGRLPFLPSAPEPMTFADRNNALNRRMSGEPVPPPADGDDNLKRVVLKALSPDPSSRWQTADEMIAALQEPEKKPESKDDIYRELFRQMSRKSPSAFFAEGAVFDIVRQNRAMFLDAIYAGDAGRMLMLFANAYSLFVEKPQVVGMSPSVINKEADDTDPFSWNADYFNLQNGDIVALVFMPVKNESVAARIVGIVFDANDNGDGYYYCMLDRDESALSVINRNRGLGGIAQVGAVRGRGAELMNSFLSIIIRDYSH